MTRFSPVWITTGDAPLNPSPLAEGSLFSYQLQAVDIATAKAPLGATVSVTFSTAPGALSSVTVNGELVTSTYWTISGKTLTLSVAHLGLTGSEATVVATRSALPKFSRLSGELPPGIRIDTAGMLTGLLSNVPPDIHHYDFSVRATNGTRVTDRSFRINVLPDAVHQTFVRTSLPTFETDPTALFDFVPFASLPRAAGYTRSLEITNADSDDALVLLPTGITHQGIEFIEGLPLGLRIDGTTLRGTIGAQAEAGRYLFRLGIAGQPITIETSFIGEVIVEDRLAGFVERPVIITWKTPSGHIGEVREGYPLHFKLSAIAEGGVRYTIAPGSLALPHGCRINSTTGDIEGVAPHVEDDTEYSFTVRATREENFVDRSFKFRVKSIYTTTEVLDVRLKLRNSELVPMTQRYGAVIDEDIQYRPNDPSFGVPNEPYIYFIKGLWAVPFDGALTGDGADAITKNKDYHGTIELVLGKHRCAVVRDDSGDVQYEVVYRELHDIHEKAGGFSFTSDEVVEDRVIHAQSLKPIFTSSIRNARYDLIRDCSFPTRDTSLRFKAGPGSAESLPLWMTSPQVADDPNSALGFIPAMLIANVKVGEGQALATSLNGDPELAPVGRSVTLDRYYLYQITYAPPTSFDGDETVFDGQQWSVNRINFDTAVEGSEKPIQV